MINSPLAFPVTLKDNYLEVLDETLLPFQEKYIKVKTFEESLLVLGSMKTRAMGQVLLFFYSCILFKGKYSIDDVGENREMLFDLENDPGEMINCVDLRAYKDIQKRLQRELLRDLDSRGVKLKQPIA